MNHGKEVQQDYEDLARIANIRYNDIKVDKLKKLTKNDLELQEMLNTPKFYAEN